MTIRFAAANPEHNPLIARALIMPARRWAANDNIPGVCNDTLLKAALRHFAEHGLGAAEHARALAERAFFTGDRDDYRWWLDICRTLDRRMAEAVATRTDAAIKEAVENLPETSHKTMS